MLCGSAGDMEAKDHIIKIVIIQYILAGHTAYESHNTLANASRLNEGFRRRSRRKCSRVLKVIARVGDTGVEAR